MKKFNIKVGDRKFIVKAKDNIDAVRKLKSSLADASDERDVVFNKYYVKPGMKIWLNGKFQPIQNIEWGYKYAKVYTSSNEWYEFDVGKKVTVKDARTMGRYKSKSGKVYIIKEDTGYGSIGSYPYVTDDKGKWVPVPNEIRKGGFKALYELIHSGGIEKYITDSSIKDASPIIVEAIPYKNEMYVVLEFSWNGSKRWIVVAKENYHNEKKYTGGGVVEYSLNGAKKTADDFYTMNKADKVNEIKDYGRDIAVPGTNFIAIGIEDLFDYIRWIKDSLSKGDKSRAERLAEDFKRLLSERKKSVAGLPQYTNAISKYIQEAEKEFNSIKM